MQYYLFFLALAIILLAGVKFAGLKEFHEDGLSLDNSKCVLGVMAILIMCHHISQNPQFGEVHEMRFMQNVGVLIVGVFFFFSGYGLFKSFKLKDNYLKHFFRKRFVTVLIPFYVVNVFYIIVFSLLKILPSAGPVEWIKRITGFSLVNGNAWYIVLIAIGYIIFYLTFRFLKEGWAILAMFVCTGLYIAYALPLDHSDAWFGGEWWYNTCIFLTIGILFAKFETQILNIVHKIYYFLLPVSVVGFYFVFRKNEQNLERLSYWCEYEGIPHAEVVQRRLICLSWQVFAVLLFVMIVLLLMMKLRFKNPVLSFLGKISLEIYLIHGLFLEMFRCPYKIYITNNLAYLAACVICAVLFAFLIHKVDIVIERLLLPRKKEGVA